MFQDMVRPVILPEQILAPVHTRNSIPDNPSLQNYRQRTVPEAINQQTQLTDSTMDAATGTTPAARYSTSQARAACNWSVLEGCGKRPLIDFNGL
jgi:hypothetical protein